MKEDKYGHYQYYEIFRTHYKEHNQPENMCDIGDGNSTTRECIEKFIDSNLGCHIPWHINERMRGAKDCSDEDQFQRYVLLSNNLSTLDAKDMEYNTGCLRRCDRMEYKLWETTPLGEKAKYPPQKLKLSFIFSSGKSQYVEKKLYNKTHHQVIMK